jgi:Concanavalin A-like lectin/glucanases superfamily
VPTSKPKQKVSAICVSIALVFLATSGCQKKSESTVSAPPPSAAPANATPSSTPPSAPASSPASGAAAGQDLAGIVKASNPIAYFRLEDSSGIAEVGGAGYRPVGGVAVSSSCAPIKMSGNQCVVLNGKDGRIATTQNGGIANAVTIMAWVNLAALPSTASHIFYVAGESQSGNDLDLQFEGDNAIKFFTAAGGSLDYKPNPATLVNQWHMIVATMDVAAKTRAIYWDGAPVNSDQDPGKPNKTSAFSIGESTVFTGRFFNGSIDEVALWNRALTAAEVAAIYNSTK